MTSTDTRLRQNMRRAIGRLEAGLSPFAVDPDTLRQPHRANLAWAHARTMRELHKRGFVSESAAFRPIVTPAGYAFAAAFDRHAAKVRPCAVKFSPADLEALRRFTSNVEAARHFGCGVDTIRRVRRREGMPTLKPSPAPRVWSDRERRTVVALYEAYGPAALAERFGATPEAVRALYKRELLALAES